MGFEALLQNETLKKALAGTLENGKAGHAYLFCGPEGVGKRTAALAFAEGLLCQGKGAPPCGRCPHCGKVQRMTHPDLILIAPEEGSRSVKVDAIRALRKDAYIRPSEGARKVYLLTHAGDMTVQAQNALLKLLEEPPAYAVFLLLAESAEQLLSTVRSRCVIFHVAPLDAATVRAELARRVPRAKGDAVAAAAALSRGCLGQGLALLEQKAFTQAGPLCDKYFEALSKTSLFSLLSLSVPLSQNRDVLVLTVSLIERRLSELIALRASRRTPAEGPLADGGLWLTNGAAVHIINLIEELRRRADQNGNLSLQALWFLQMSWEELH